MIKKMARFSQLTIALLAFAVAAASADTLDNIIKSGTVRVGVALFTPWTIEDQAKQLSGFEIDVANKLAQDMGVEAKYSVYEWDDIIDALQRGEIDVIAGGMAITPARALKVNFSLPYADSGVSLITHTAKTFEWLVVRLANRVSGW